MKKLLYTLILFIGISTISYAQWSTAGTNVYLTTTTNEVGIGTINPSNGKLNIVPAGTSFSSSAIRFTSSLGNSQDWYFYMDANDNYVISDDGTDKVTIQNGTGNIGIGTSFPQYPLHIDRTDAERGIYIDNTYTGANSKTGVYSYLDAGGTGTRYGFYSNTIGNAADPSSSYGVYSFATGNGNAGSVFGVYGDVSTSGTGNHYAIFGANSSSASNNWAGYFTGRGYFGGNVGIGTTAPTAKLHVDGNSADQYGLRIDNDYTGTSSKYGIYNELNALGTGIRTGIHNVTEGNGSDASTVYGQFNTTTSNGSAADVYGVYSTVNSVGSGNHFAVFGIAPAVANNWAGYFNGHAYVGGNLGIATNSPVNKLDVHGSVAIGNSYAGTSTAPGNGLIVEGNVGIGTSSPAANLHVQSTGVYPAIFRSSASESIVEIDNTSTNGRRWWFISGGSGGALNGGKFGIFDRTGFATRFAIDVNGNIGIGTSNPTEKLDVNGKARVRDLVLDNSKDSVLVASGDGTLAYRDASTLNGAWAISDTNIYNTNTGSVLIGTTSPATGYKLAVDGRIIAEEIQILPSTSWPDYVFNKDYKLMPLKEVDTFVKQNKHLPGVPSAKTVEEEGISVGEMSKLMMEKIEELTLHAIEQSKQMQEQFKQNEEQAKQLTEQSNQIRKLQEENLELLKRMN